MARAAQRAPWNLVYNGPAFQAARPNGTFKNPATPTSWEELRTSVIAWSVPHILYGLIDTDDIVDLLDRLKRRFDKHYLGVIVSISAVARMATEFIDCVISEASWAPGETWQDIWSDALGEDELFRPSRESLQRPAASPKERGD